MFSKLWNLGEIWIQDWKILDPDPNSFKFGIQHWAVASCTLFHLYPGFPDKRCPHLCDFMIEDQSTVVERKNQEAEGGGIPGLKRSVSAVRMKCLAPSR